MTIGSPRTIVLSACILRLRAAWGDPEGAPTLVRAEVTAQVSDLSSAERLGDEVAAQLRAQGAH